jgi:hypothetical protein
MIDKYKSQKKFTPFGHSIVNANPYALPPLPKPVPYKPKIA